MLRSHNVQISSCEQQGKFVQERIIAVEKNFAGLCTSFGGYAKRTAGVRDKNDELAKVIKTYADTENINKSLKNGLLQFSAILSSLGDFRDIEVKRLEGKVISELSQYEGICKHAREEVKATFSAREREQTKIRHLDRIRARNPHNRQLIIAAEAEVFQAGAEVSRNVKVLEEQVDMFEKRKMHDIKSILLDFVRIELSFHAKALEMFTRAYNEVQNINEDADLAEFRNILRVPDSLSRLSTVKRTAFRGSTPLGSLANLFGNPSRLSQSLEPEGSQPSARAKPNTKSSSVDSLKKGLGSVESVEGGDMDNEEGSSLLSYEEDDQNSVDDDRNSADMIISRHPVPRRH